MADDRGIALVIDRPRLQDGLCGAEDLLDLPQLAIGERHRQRGKRRVGAQHIEAVEAGVLGDAGRIDLEVTTARRGEEVYKSELDLTDSVGYLAPMGVSVVFRWPWIFP